MPVTTESASKQNDEVRNQFETTSKMLESVRLAVADSGIPMVVAQQERGKMDVKDIQKLRDQTGYGLADCKKALTESSGDFEAAKTELEKRGVNRAAIKVDRPTGNGVVRAYTNNHFGFAVVVEVRCEQEPTVKTEQFERFVNKQIVALSASHVNETDSRLFVEEDRKRLISVLNENIVVGKIKRYPPSVESNGAIHFGKYEHFNGKAAAVVVFRGEGEVNEQTQRVFDNIAMHVTATNPKAATRAKLDTIEVAKVRQKFEQEAQGKPEAIREKIINGKMNGFFKEHVIVDQTFVLDDDGKTTIQNMLDRVEKESGTKFEIEDFMLVELGVE